MLPKFFGVLLSIWPNPFKDQRYQAFAYSKNRSQSLLIGTGFLTGCREHLQAAQFISGWNGTLFVVVDLLPVAARQICRKLRGRRKYGWFSTV